jgi:hypothetical protein
LCTRAGTSGRREGRSICGLSGFFRWGNDAPHPETLRGLFEANEVRGKDAAGLCYLDGGTIRVFKEPGPPTTFAKTVDWEAVARAPWALMHSRAKTLGSEKDNDNNHPVVLNKWVVTHNGSVYNDTALFEHYKDQRPAIVDSIAVPLVLSKGKTLEESLAMLTVLSGNITMGAVHAADPSTVILARLGIHELYLYLDDDILYWTSALGGQKHLPYTGLGSIRFLNMGRLVENRVLVLTPAKKGSLTYAVTRNPFVSAKAPSPATSVPSTKAAAAGAATTRWNYTWERPLADAMAWPGKPVLLMDDVEVTPPAFLEGGIRQRMTTASISEVREFATPYGRWGMMWPASNSIVGTFRGRKSMRRWLHSICKEFGISWTPWPAVPAVAAKLKDVLAVERFDLASMANGAGVSVNCWLCGWCGAWAPHSHWEASNMTCHWCKITSRRYNNG